MLAVVFWNSRNAGSTDADYERALSGFHDELRTDKPRGLRRSVSFLVESGVPWLRSEYPIYEDWYVMTNFAALDNLDRRILESDSLPSHRALMTRTGCASGAVVYLERGTPYVERSRLAYWFSKPRDKTVDDVAALAHQTEPPKNVSVWTRAMALGPAGNCILLNKPVELPGACEAVEIRRTVFWSP